MHFENEIEHKILVTYVIAKVSNCHSHAGGNLVCSVSVISDKFLLLFISRFPLSWE
ncbi:FIG00849287: hypothetical protein [Neisseria meningitidis serogroup B]|uniref:Uncharacterized protein n=1 Tax=Neisseria meningitidis serogroup B TaxID=491 RepID=A0A0H5QTK3_NEIMI|nr:FIG00849287: hypothetical protein [Neisseria meningitidis serogroup B]CRY99014.1 FIG00849287: hypothetical protein [Neisseria meningitidis serogroup B]